MTIGGFPGSKMLLQLFRQLTKPLSTSIINFAKRHPSFRQHMLITPGQYYHWCDTVSRQYFRSGRWNDDINAKIERPKVREIEESVAIEVGAQLMIETLVFVILAGFVIYESSKSAARSQLLEDSRESEFGAILDRRNDLSRRLEHQAAQIRDLRSRLGDYGSEVGYPFQGGSAILEEPDTQ